ncbi:hypothetical protein, partial [Armatimonas sp.]|uniref:hypothetical protein n=1 Tax=Armatimonas sp. TaxID=1872638 RepID=UPI00374C9117
MSLLHESLNRRFFPPIETLVVNYVFAVPSPFEGLKSLATNAFGASSGRGKRKQNGRMRQAN